MRLAPPAEAVLGRENYYLILEVARSESPARIRARYRDLVRTLHPDVAGAQSADAFRDVTEAYEVLADPQARRRHDIELDAWEPRPRVEATRGAKHRTRRARDERPRRGR